MMDTIETTEGILSLRIEQIRVSMTGSQAERRAHFDKVKIAELADSIKTVGLLQPIVARPVEDHFELVAGERRFLAAQVAGLESISVSVRDLTDEQVLEVQLIENLQREGLHELAEAEGYDALSKLGHGAEEIAAKIGKSKSHVYGRMKLLSLCPAAREAFYRGDISASIALLLARIPVGSIQAEAVEEIIKPNWDDEVMSFRQAKDLILAHYMATLGDASFPTGDADLVPMAGACGPCPKRTGNQPELFEDVKGTDVCTDPVCFKAKREAWSRIQIAQAKETGRRVITGAEAKKIAPNDWVSNGYNRLTDTCYDDPKNRSYQELLGKNRDVVSMLQMPKSGEVVEVVNKHEAVTLLRKLGKIETPKGGSIYGSALPKAKPIDKAKRAEQEALRDKLLVYIHKNSPTSVTRSALLRVAEILIDSSRSQYPQGFFTAWGWDADNFDKLPRLSDSDLHKFCNEMLLLDSLPFDNLDLEITKLTKAAKDLGIDVKRVKVEAAGIAVPKAAAPAAAKTATKKAAKKK